jgi:hypothetical protein
MPIAYLLDENIRNLWRAIQHHNRRGMHLIDAARVGDRADLPLGSEDQAILLWCERENRILVSRDWNTLATHLEAHWAAGHHSPGVFMIRDSNAYRAALEFMVLASLASEPDEWRDRIEYIA